MEGLRVLAVAKDEAVYLHKLCVRREFAGKNMTYFTIEAIKQLCKKKRNKVYTVRYST